MDDALLVRGFECLRDLLRDRQGLVERDRATRDALREILTVDEFHHERVHADGFLEPVDRRDVGMIQRRERLRLTLEPRQAFGVRRERVRQDLDRDLAIERRVGCPIHLAHSTHTDLGGDFIRAEARAGSEAQG
jgi:hypothetical protein